MAKYERLPTNKINLDAVSLPSHSLPELVHLDDQATAIMSDFSLFPPHTISPKKPMDSAIEEIKKTDLHLLLVVREGHLIGIINSQDLLGEKPIKIIQERRISRNQVLVEMLMVPTAQLIAFELDTIKDAKVGHIVKTLSEEKKQYALVLESDSSTKEKTVRGIFTTTQISKQLHMPIDANIKKAESVSELQKRV